MHIPNRVTKLKYPYLDSVLRIEKRWRGGPGVLLGDTNCGRIGVDEETPCINQREDSWMASLEESHWKDAYRVLHGQRRVYSWYSPQAKNGFRLDQAFLNEPLAKRLRTARYAWGGADSVASISTTLSDHAALIVDLV